MRVKIEVIATQFYTHTGMTRLDTLRSELATLEEQSRAIKAKGDILTGCSIDSSKPRGNASKGASLQYRLRFREPQADGKKSRYLKSDEVAPARDAIVRAKRLAKVERRRTAVAQQLEAIAVRATALGLVMPE